MRPDTEGAGAKKHPETDEYAEAERDEECLSSDSECGREVNPLTKMPDRTKRQMEDHPAFSQESDLKTPVSCPQKSPFSLYADDIQDSVNRKIHCTSSH